MLKKLHILNYAIIDELDLQFSNGLNIITGETGAGKSIMLGALSLLTGSRADSKVLFNKDSKCVVEAIYDNLPKGLNKYLDTEGFDTDEELIIRREIGSNGKSRAFINDTPAKLAILTQASSQLIDLNRQFELLDIQKADFQLTMIDNVAGHLKAIEKYKSGFQDFKAIEKELTELKRTEADAKKEHDYLKFQFDEFSTLGLLSGEQELLEKESTVIEKSNEIIELSSESMYLLTESESAIQDQIRMLSHKWSSLAELKPDYKEISDAFMQLETVLEEIASTIKGTEESMDVDPSRKTEVEERLNAFYKLLQKHQVQNQEELETLMSSLEEKIVDFSSREEKIISFEKKYATLKKDLLAQAESISKARKKAFPKLEKEIHKLLADLSMNSAKIQIQNESSQELNKNGIDNIEIAFTANVGSAFKPIKAVASGGELSRLMLAMKTTIAGKVDLPTMVFDEIDTGVSGEVAHKMGQLMNQLSKNHQLIVITHSPQVASKANTHFHIYKEENQKRSFTRMKTLTSEERITEIAKMLSGDKLSDSAISNARELLSLN